jgi:hypothetical protein
MPCRRHHCGTNLPLIRQDRLVYWHRRPDIGHVMKASEMTTVQKLIVSLVFAAIFAQSMAALVGPATVENVASVSTPVTTADTTPTPAS